MFNWFKLKKETKANQKQMRETQLVGKILPVEQKQNAPQTFENNSHALSE